MSFILSILKGIQKFNKVRKEVMATAKKVGKVVKLTTKDIGKVIRDALLTFVITATLIVAVIGGALFSVTGAVSDLFNKIMEIHDSSSVPDVSTYSSLTQEQIKEMRDSTGASLDPSKIAKYMEKEASSVPSSKDGTEVTINNDGTNSTESNKTVSIDLSDYVNMYKLNWEFIASVDLAIFEADDASKTKALDGANSLYPVFTWKDCSRDTTDSWMSWTETTEYDPSTGTTDVTYNDQDSAKENYTTEKVPLAIPSKVSTLFGDYIYQISDDVVVKDDPYCDAYIDSQEVSYREELDHYQDDHSKPINSEQVNVNVRGGSTSSTYDVPIDVNENFNKDEKIVYGYKGIEGDYYIYKNTNFWWNSFELKLPISSMSEDEANQTMTFYSEYSTFPTTGYEQEAVYKTITITKNIMKKTKQKVVEDQVANTKQNFDPTKFIKYINDCGLSVKDLDLVKECLINIPSGNIIVDNIDRIINGDYGDINNGSGGNTSSDGNAQIGGSIPLFLQYDRKWADKPYSGSTIGAAGCGITSMSMVISGLGGDIKSVQKYDEDGDGILNPYEVSLYATEHGHSTNRQGTAKSLYADLGAKMGLKVTNTNNPTDVYNALKLGNVVIASMTPGHFTQGSHLLVITGIPLEGMVSINDPASEERSKVNWDWNVVKSEADDYWIFENPNFVTESFIITSYYGATFSDIPPLTKTEVDLQGGNLQTSTGLSLVTKDLRDRICAVDPTVIPYHSKLYISFSDLSSMKMPDGTNVPMNGYYTAEDTGGAFQGGKKKIDLYAGTYSKSPTYKDIAYAIGTRNATVKYRKK